MSISKNIKNTSKMWQNPYCLDLAIKDHLHEVTLLGSELTGAIAMKVKVALAQEKVDLMLLLQARYGHGLRSSQPFQIALKNAIKLDEAWKFSKALKDGEDAGIKRRYDQNLLGLLGILEEEFGNSPLVEQRYAKFASKAVENDRY